MGRDIEETQGTAPNYPIIADRDFNVSKLYDMLPPDTTGDPAARTPADNQTVRNVFVIGPDKKIKLILVYPMTTGRNFDEVLRVIDSLQLTANHKVATPVNWQQGDDVIIAGSVSDDQARENFGQWESPKPYIRIVPNRSRDQVAGRARAHPGPRPLARPLDPTCQPGGRLALPGVGQQVHDQRRVNVRERQTDGAQSLAPPDLGHTSGRAWHGGVDPRLVDHHVHVLGVPQGREDLAGDPEGRPAVMVLLGRFGKREREFACLVGGHRRLCDVVVVAAKRRR